MIAMTVTFAFIHGVFEPIEQWGIQAQFQSQKPLVASQVNSLAFGRHQNVDHLRAQKHSILQSFPYLSGAQDGVDLSILQWGTVSANDYTKSEEEVSIHSKPWLLVGFPQERAFHRSGVFSEAPVHRVPQAVMVGLIMLGSFLAVWLSKRWGSDSAVRVVGLIGLVFVMFSLGVGAPFGVWIDLVPFPLALVMGCVASIMIRELGRYQKIPQGSVESTFSPAPTLSLARVTPFVPPHHRMVTVLFVDIRGFSQMAETLSPEEVSGLLGEFYTEMTEAVTHHGGMIDKFMGDAVMALFNVPHFQPDHADRAVSAALDCQQRLRRLAVHFQQRYGRSLACGFGLHTGEALVGTMGSVHRMDYTAMGDTVNLGANLEGLSKVYGVPIVMSESTHQALTLVCHSRYLDEIRVKGRERFVRIYTVTEKDDRQVSRVPMQGHAVVQQFGVRSLGKIYDVSRGGLALEQLERPLIEGSLLDLDLHSDDGDGPLSFQAKVIWAQSHRAGFEFLETTQDFQPGVETFLSRSA
ncbi:MAG: PilZ domain-containing protein [Nitrospirae bacterium]|nr:PilZ domain-containing protein [Nitrospirota bacterium]